MATWVGPAERLQLYRRLFHELDQQRLEMDDNSAGRILVQAEIQALEDLIMHFAELSATVPPHESKQLVPGPADLPPSVEGLDMSVLGDLLMLSATSPWIVYVAERSKLIYVSPSCKRMTGWRPSELVGTSAFDSCHTNDTASFQRMLTREVAQGIPGNYVTYRRRKKTNDYAQVQATGRAIGARWYAWVEHDSSLFEDEASPTTVSTVPPGFSSRKGPAKVVPGLPTVPDGKQGIISPYNGSMAGALCVDKSQKLKDGIVDLKILSPDLSAEVGGPASLHGLDVPKSSETKNLGLSQRRESGLAVHHDVDLLKGKKVLLVEDDVVNRKIGQRLLENVGCQVTIACNGKEALELLHKAPDESTPSTSDTKELPPRFGLVLMDLLMPVMDGTHTVEAFREWEAEQEPPRKPLLIFAVTSNVSDGDMVKCARSGFDEFVSKPLTLEKLLDRLSIRKLNESSPNRGL